MTRPRHLRLYNVDELRAVRPPTAAVFLSASEPLRKYKEYDPRYERNLHHVMTARPELIRAAVTELCKWTFQRGLAIVYGGHPAISPLVLEVARRFGPVSESPRVFIFQTDFFPESDRPRATHELVSWDVGQLVVTPKGNSLEGSLELMRELMVRWPRTVGGVFIGGMDGIEDEARRFKKADRHDAPRPCFAIASAGGAAADLLAEQPHEFSGLGRQVSHDRMLELLRHSESYALVMQHIFREQALNQEEHPA